MLSNRWIWSDSAAAGRLGQASHHLPERSDPGAANEQSRCRSSQVRGRLPERSVLPPLPERSDPVAENKQSRSRSAQQRSVLPPPRRSEATPPSQTAFRPAFDHYIPIQYTSLSLYSFYPLGMFFFL